MAQSRIYKVVIRGRLGEEEWGHVDVQDFQKILLQRIVVVLVIVVVVVVGY
jgi:hypothetical protein